MKPILFPLVTVSCLAIVTAHAAENKLAPEVSAELTIHPKIFSYIEGWQTDEGRPLTTEINLDAAERSANQFSSDEIRKENEWVMAGRDGEGIWGYRVIERKGLHYTVAYAGGRTWLGAATTNTTIEFEILKRNMKVDGKSRTIRVLRVLSLSGRKNALPVEAVRALRMARTSVLYSLQPVGRPADSEKTLDGFSVFGQTTLDSAHTATAVDAIDASISGWAGAGALCFNPHHALRVMANGHTYDFVICYSCGHLRVYRDGTPLSQVEVSRPSNILNQLLDAAGVPLSEHGQ